MHCFHLSLSSQYTRFPRLTMAKNRSQIITLQRLFLRCCSQWTEKGNKKFYDLVVISYTVKMLGLQHNLAFNQVTWKRFGTWRSGVGGIWKIVCTSGKILAMPLRYNKHLMTGCAGTVSLFPLNLNVPICFALGNIEGLCFLRGQSLYLRLSVFSLAINFWILWFKDFWEKRMQTV